MITEFAAFDGRSTRVEATVDDLRTLLSGHAPPVSFIVAEAGDAVVGFASFYRTYSTASARAGLCLEDLFVRDGWRRSGVGRLLMRSVAGTAMAWQCARVEWAVGAGNGDAIAFYGSIGAPVRPKTRVCRLHGPALAALAVGVA